MGRKKNRGVGGNVSPSYATQRPRSCPESLTSFERVLMKTHPASGLRFHSCSIVQHQPHQVPQYKSLSRLRAASSRNEKHGQTDFSSHQSTHSENDCSQRLTTSSANQTQLFAEESAFLGIMHAARVQKHLLLYYVYRTADCLERECNVQWIRVSN